MSETTAAQEELLNSENSPLEKLRHEIELSRVIELLSRGRLYLAQSNFGSAKADIQAARDLLAELAAENDKTLQSAIARLDIGLENLPDFPVVAIGDVDMAWQLLINGLPTELDTPVETKAPSTPTPEGETTTTQP